MVITPLPAKFEVHFVFDIDEYFFVLLIGQNVFTCCIKNVNPFLCALKNGLYYHNVKDYDKLCHTIHVLKIKDAEQSIKTVKKMNR